MLDGFPGNVFDLCVHKLLDGDVLLFVIMVHALDLGRQSTEIAPVA